MSEGTEVAILIVLSIVVAASNAVILIFFRKKLKAIHDAFINRQVMVKKSEPAE